MPLLYGMPGDRKPVTFVEDSRRRAGAAAGVRRPLPRDRCARHGTDGAFYGHASVGCLHIRPLLNLKDRDDVARMRRITEDVTDLVLEFGGSLSGEHGDGLARSEWNEKMFGPVVYEAFRQVKQAFDPHNLLNPGKVVDAPPMTENLRYGPGYAPVEPADRLRLQQAGGLCPLRRDVQRQRRLPQDAGRHDVPVVPGDARREATARAAGPTPCGWRWPASSRCASLRSSGSTTSSICA